MFRKRPSRNGCGEFWRKHRFPLLLVLVVLSNLACSVEAIEIQGERVFAFHAPRLIWGNAQAGKKVALTFDDAPNGYTREILAVLGEFQVRATFFLIGTQVMRHPELARLIIALGHEIGNHSFSHAFTEECSEVDLEGDIRRAEDVIFEVTGRLPLYFRPPGGLVTQALRRACGALGYGIVLWSVDSRDWKAKSVDEVVTSVLGKVHPGAIVLFHSLPHTVQALPRILRALQEEGYDIVPVSGLLWP